MEYGQSLNQSMTKEKLNPNEVYREQLIDKLSDTLCQINGGDLYTLNTKLIPLEMMNIFRGIGESLSDYNKKVISTNSVFAANINTNKWVVINIGSIQSVKCV